MCAAELGDDMGGDVGGDVGGDEGGGEPSLDPLPAWDHSLFFTGGRDGRIAGTIGPVANMDRPTDIVHIYDDGYYTEIEVFALSTDGTRVMIQLQVDSINGEGFFVPGVAKRLRPGYTTAGNVGALACAGEDSGNTVQPFLNDPAFDAEPCEVGVDTEQDGDQPQALRVTVQATLPDENGDCPEAPGAGIGDGDFGEEDLPDLDGDGDGDLPGGVDDPSQPPPGGGGAGGSHPLATAAFVMTR